MYAAQQARPLWEQVYWLEREALDAWRLLHAKQESVTDALALHAEVLVTKVRRSRGGNVTVTVLVECHGYGKSEQAFFRLRKAKKGGYRVILQDLPVGLD